MNTHFDMAALRAMLAGIEQGSFVRAASELNRSQSAVSMQLKKLEQQAGTRLFEKKGRGLVLTEAGESFVSYARQIITLNDEAARMLGAVTEQESVRLGLPQDFYDDVMPATVNAFSREHPNVHISVRAGNNHIIEDEINAGRLDGAIAFFPKGSRSRGELLRELPLRWLAHKKLAEVRKGEEVPLVLFNHRCLFRQQTLASLENADLRWRKILTTPSLAAVWSALRSGFGVGVRVEHGVPKDIVDVSQWKLLPKLPKVELRLLTRESPSPAVQNMIEILRTNTLERIKH